MWRPTKDISIHALRGEGDQNNTPKKARDYYFNPRPPWGGRPIQTVFEILLVVFQSTPSVGRATKGMIENGKQHIHFNPRPPWGGRQYPAVLTDEVFEFQSTPSVGRATTVLRLRRGLTIDFNPRPPWGGRLSLVCYIVSIILYFNPRPPWGGRPNPSRPYALSIAFQSTPSVGRATPPDGTPPSVYEISIHALRGEGDDNKPYEIDIRPAISIHALRGEGDQLLL